MTENAHRPSLYYDPEGRPIEFDAWHALFVEDETRFVVRDMLLVPAFPRASPAPVRVVTAWLGTDQRAGAGNERPLIYGTCCFFDGVHDGDRAASVEVEWYATRGDALAGHAAWLAALRHASPAQIAELHERLLARAAAFSAAEADEPEAGARSDAAFFASEAVYEALDALRAAVDPRSPESGTA